MGQRNGDPDKQKRIVRIARTPQRVRADDGFASLQRSAACSKAARKCVRRRKLFYEIDRLSGVEPLT
jgi:hypothetical protein